LIQVIPIKLEDLSPEFRHHDTTYIDGGEERQYPLPERGEYMVLLLQAGSGCGKLWSTIRSQVGRNGRDKLSYYKSMTGKIFECKVI
jgi:hypothetical protein